MRKPDFCFGPFPDRLVSNMAMEKILGGGGGTTIEGMVLRWVNRKKNWTLICIICMYSPSTKN